MAEARFVEFPESRMPVSREGTRRIAVLGDDEPVEVSLYLKPRPEPAGGRPAVLAQRERQYAPDVEAIRRFAAAYRLQVIAAEPRRRLVRLQGTASDMRAAFKVDLYHCETPGGRFRTYDGALHLREDIASLVESVLGLDTRPVARPRLRVRRADTAAAFLPNRIGSLYGIPTNHTGAGQCIALIELGGGYHDSDIRTAFAAMGITPPVVVAVSVDGATNAPSTPDSADGEVGLDIQVAGGIAPGARLAVYFTPNTDAGFADAVSQAATDTTNDPSVMSISWGGPESVWSAQARATLDNALRDAGLAGVTVTVAAGDSLATDGLSDGQAHVDYPAASPYALGCGGTAITVAGARITAETVWNDGASGTGGGVSSAYPVPSFQSAFTLPVNVNTGRPGRGVPDVAGDAEPASGYRIIVDGETLAVGGTSAVAPLWAGFFALVNAARGDRLGFVNAALYAEASQAGANGFREITIGNNKPAGTELGYDAGAGWNACTGLGVMRGAQLFAALIGAIAVAAGEPLGVPQSRGVPGPMMMSTTSTP